MYFGTAMPISGQVKHWWSTLPNTVYGHDFNLGVFLSLSPGNNLGRGLFVTVRLNDIVTRLLEPYKLSYEPKLLDQCNHYPWVDLLGFESCCSKLPGFDWRESTRRIGLHALSAGCLLQISYYLATTYPNPRSWYWVG